MVSISWFHLTPKQGRALNGFLVNTALATLTAPDTVTVGDTQLPVSRKYREAVQQLPMLA